MNAGVYGSGIFYGMNKYGSNGVLTDRDWESGSKLVLLNLIWKHY